MIIFVRDVGGTHRNVTFQNSSFDNKKTGYGAENALQGGGQVSTRRHVCRWCPFFRLGFRFLPHFPTTPGTSASLHHQHFTAIPPTTLHHIHTPHQPALNSSVTDDIFVAAILAAICSAFSALAPFVVCLRASALRTGSLWSHLLVTFIVKHGRCTV